MLEVSKRGIQFEMFVFLRHFLSICSYTIFSDRPQFAPMKLYNINALSFNRESAEPYGSASGCGGSPKQTETTWDEIRNHSSVRLCQYRNLDHCIGFHEQRKHLRKVPLQQKD